MNERPYKTYLDRKIPEEEINVMNVIVENFLKHQNEIDIWIINVTTYSAAVTLLERYGKLKEVKTNYKKIKETTQIKHLNKQVDKIRKKVAHIDIVLKLQNEDQIPTKKQKSIKKQLKKIYGNTNEKKLRSERALVIHQLKVATEKLRRATSINERKNINRNFQYNPKMIYRNFRNDKNIIVNNPPKKNEIKEFWNNIWGKEKSFNDKATWLEELKNNYCQNVETQDYIINNQIVEEVIKSMANSKAPGNDLVVHIWHKKLKSLWKYLTLVFNKFLDNTVDIPDWLPMSKTILLPKTDETVNPKNYRPIACENNVFKIYTGILSRFINQHCLNNNIIYQEQAANRSGSWGCIDQLLINKTIMEEAVKYKRNIFTIWLDYKKAYDSVPHDWILQSLKLAKVPNNIINSIKNIINKWSAKMHLNTIDKVIQIENINYKTGMMQGDTLSVIIFLLCFNPLSYLLRKTEGYQIGIPGDRSKSITHLAFVDDFKLFANKISNAKQQLDIVTKFSNDIGMAFGEDKCAYIYIERGKRKSLGNNIEMNGVRIQEIEKEDTYKYLGMEESISYNDNINKDNILKEYKRRLRKIWSSELNAYNKVTATNMFATPVVTYSFGIIRWTREEILHFDIITRKIMNMNNSLNRRSDIHRIYLPRQKGGRGLRNIEVEFLCKIVGIVDHLKKEQHKNTFITKVLQHEKDNLIKVNNLIKEELEIEATTDGNQLTYEIKQKLQQIKLQKWEEKVTHGYLSRKMKDIDASIDHNRTWSWLKSSTLTSQVESFICSMQEQEINTREARKRHEKDPAKKRIINSSCRMCKQNEENLQHILGVCPAISSNLYLNARHNPVAEVIYFEILKKFELKSQNQYKPVNILVQREFEIWWDQKISTPNNIAHNKPDIVIWNHKEKRCQIIDISVPLDFNICKKMNEKKDHYMALVSELQRLYKEYKFDIIPIVVGSLGYIPKDLSKYLDELNLNISVIFKIQQKAIIGSLKVVKTFMKMKE